MKNSVLLLFILLITINLPEFVFAQKQQTVKLLEDKLSKASDKQKPLYLNQLASIYVKTDTKKAIDYAENAYKIARKNSLTESEADALNILGNLYYSQKEFKKAAEKFEDEFKIRKKNEISHKDLSISAFNIASTYQLSGKERQAIQYYEISLQYAQKLQEKALLSKIYESLFNLYFSRGKHEQALTNFIAFVQLRDSSYKVKNYQQLTIIKSQEEKIKQELTTKDSIIKKSDSTLKSSQQKDTTITQLNFEKMLHEKQLEYMRLYRNFFIAIAVFVALVALLYIQRYLYKKKVNNQLKLQNIQISQQKEQIENQRNNLEELNIELNQKNKNITDSIMYARRIQRAVIPNEANLKHFFTGYFVLYKPRDIVSGDFFWTADCEGKVIVAAADCTGHGVPGAFMSMLGITLLNEIVLQLEITDSDKILEFLRIRIKKLLQQTGKDDEAKDGMDIALCVFEKGKNLLQFSGANSPLYIVRNGELLQYKPTKNPIGIFLKEIPFVKIIIEINPHDRFYLFSDGYIDQFGGEKQHRFRSARFKDLIKKISKLTMQEQEEILARTFFEWKGEIIDQLDDVLVVGLEL